MGKPVYSTADVAAIRKAIDYSTSGFEKRHKDINRNSHIDYMSQLVIIGEEYEWIKYSPNALVVAYPEELEFVVDGDKVTFYYAKKEVVPSTVLWRIADEKPFELRLLRALNGCVRTINKPDIILECRDQFSVLKRLKQNKLPVPRTVSISGKHYPEFTYPAVLKMEGIHRGERKALVKSEDVVENTLAMLPFSSSKYLLQEYLEVENDYRALVIGGKVIDVIERISDHWIKSRDATMSMLPINVPQISQMALKAAKILGAEVAGVDIVRTKEDDYFLLEVVTEPDFKAFGEKAYMETINHIEKGTRL